MLSVVEDEARKKRLLQSHFSGVRALSSGYGDATSPSREGLALPQRVTRLQGYFGSLGHVVVIIKVSSVTTLGLASLLPACAPEPPTQVASVLVNRPYHPSLEATATPG